MTTRATLLLLACIQCFIIGASAGEIKANNIMKAVLAQLPEGNEYNFDNVETTVTKADGTT